MKNFMFKKIEMWFLLLLIIFGILSVVSLMWLVRYETEVPGKFGKFGKYIISVSKIPGQIKQAIDNPLKNPFIIKDEPNRFGNKSGLITNYQLGSRNTYPFLLVN